MELRIHHSTFCASLLAPKTPDVHQGVQREAKFRISYVSLQSLPTENHVRMAKKKQEQNQEQNQEQEPDWGQTVGWFIIKTVPNKQKKKNETFGFVQEVTNLR